MKLKNTTNKEQKINKWNKWKKLTKFIQNATISTLILLAANAWFSQEKQFWTDISKHNNFDYEEFVARNRKKRDIKETNPEKDIRWITFIYIRSSHWDNKDPKALDHFKMITKYNQDPRVKENEKIAIGCYHYFWHSKTNINTQIKIFLEQYNKINKENDWTVDLIPMLDIEHLEWADKEHVRTRALQWLEWVEKATWVVPWLYMGATNYYNFMHVDKRFNKYKVRIAGYTPTRVDQEKWSVKIGANHEATIKPNIYQFWENWAIWWIWAKWGKADMNNTNNLEELIIKNNDYEWEKHIKDFTYHRTSFDKENEILYEIYSYIIKNHGNKEQILNVFEKNWWNKEGALVTDASWKEYNKDIDHKQWTKVYIKEKIKIDNKNYWDDFIYSWVEEINDKYYQKYSYTIKKWWNYWWVLKQFQNNWWDIEWVKAYTIDNNWNLQELDKKTRYTEWTEIFLLKWI